MLLIKAAFTLPGLAGLVHDNVGMAVDAKRVDLPSRMREEAARGRASLRMTIRNGFFARDARRSSTRT